MDERDRSTVGSDWEPLHVSTIQEEGGVPEETSGRRNQMLRKSVTEGTRGRGKQWAREAVAEGASGRANQWLREPVDAKTSADSPSASPARSLDAARSPLASSRIFE